jgi:hypothetical protein
MLDAGHHAHGQVEGGSQALAGRSAETAGLGADDANRLVGGVDRHDGAAVHAHRAGIRNASNRRATARTTLTVRSVSSRLRGVGPRRVVRGTPGDRSLARREATWCSDRWSGPSGSALGPVRVGLSLQGESWRPRHHAATLPGAPLVDALVDALVAIHGATPHRGRLVFRRRQGDTGRSDRRASARDQRQRDRRAHSPGDQLATVDARRMVQTVTPRSEGRVEVSLVALGSGGTRDGGRARADWQGSRQSPGSGTWYIPERRWRCWRGGRRCAKVEADDTGETPSRVNRPAVYNWCAL